MRFKQLDVLAWRLVSRHPRYTTFVRIGIYPLPGVDNGYPMDTP